MRISFKLGLLVAVVASQACVSKKPNTIAVSDVYNKKRDLTMFDKSPLGFVEIPGKWSRTSYDEVSKQYFFQNKDSISIAIAISLVSYYPFYKQGMHDFDFLKAYYEWDSKYLAEKTKGTREISSQDSVSRKYILWHVYNKKTIDGYYLNGLHKGVFYNFFVTTDKMSEAQKIELLKTMYKQTQK